MNCDTGKTMFDTRAAAKAATGGGRAYKCTYCHAWHVTRNGALYKASSCLKRSPHDASVQRVWEL